MRVGLNLLHAMPEIGGGWNYISRLIWALGEYDHENEYIAFVTEKSIKIVPKKQNFKIVKVRINPISRVQRILYENTMLQLNAIKQKVDLLHWFANTMSFIRVTPGIATIYDLLVYEMPKSFSLMQRVYIKTMIPYTVRHAVGLLPMSRTTADNLYVILNALPNRMQVIPAIVNEAFRPATLEKIRSVKEKYELPEKFWLYVAHFYPHKNHRRLLNAYHVAKTRGVSLWPLMLRGNDQGMRNIIEEHVVRLNLENDVRFLPRFEEEELATLYSMATALIFPSMYEGCGIPVVEAMACGCPVVAASVPSVIENAGNAAVYFNPYDEASIADAMVSFQNMDAVTIHLKRNEGLQRADDYRPKKIVDMLKNAYKQAKKN